MSIYTQIPIYGEATELTRLKGVMFNLIFYKLLLIEGKALLMPNLPAHR
jgi:hypothetical protein